MTKILLIITMLLANIYADSNEFEKIVNSIIKQEIEKIKKPSNKLKLVKDEFETTSEFKTRVAKTKKNQKNIIKNYEKKVAQTRKKAKMKAIKTALQYTWGKPTLKGLRYDADNGYFVAQLHFKNRPTFEKKVAIKINRKYAREFKREFNSIKPQAIYDYNGRSVKLKTIEIPFKEKKYLALFTDKNIDDTRVAVNIENDYNINSSDTLKLSIAKNEVQSFNTSSLVNFYELDKLLKKSPAVKKDRKKWLFVVGIEQYDSTISIPYAKRSAEMFVKIAHKKLGVPKQNSYVLINSGATQAKIKTSFKKLLRRVKKGDTIYFYYNGHGIPIPALKNEPFMLPSDSEPDYIADESFFSLRNIYGKLSKSKAKKIIAVVDSCFSGMTDGKAIVKGVAAARLKAKRVEFNKKKMVVLSAGKADQYSNGYNKKGYRLFSFFVMKNIIEGKRDIKKLYKSSRSETYDASLKEYGDLRTQDPSISGNEKLWL